MSNAKARELKASGYIENSFDLTTVSKAREVGASQILLRACENKLVEQRDLLENRCRIVVDGDYKKDFRYVAGMIAGIKWVLQFPEMARKAIKQVEQ